MSDFDDSNIERDAVESPFGRVQVGSIVGMEIAQLQVSRAAVRRLEVG